MLNKNYRTVVKETNGCFYAVCETLNVVAKGQDLSTAYVELQTLRQNLLARFEEMGLAPPQPDNLNLMSPDHSKKKRSDTYLKMLMVVGICVVFLIGIAVPILNAVNGVIKPLKGISVKLETLSDPAALSKMVANVANILKEITPQRREELHQNLKTIVNEMEPFVDDVRPLIFETQNSKSTN